MTISAAIITHNEERNIRRCLESLQNLVDEIVVLDAYSSDKTPEICREMAVNFHQREWEGYAKSKNYLNSLTTGAYILSIDADEAPDEVLQGELLELKARNEAGVYRLNRLTNYCGKWIHHGGWYPDYKVRLFPKNGSYWSGDFVHEELVYPEELPVNTLKGHLLHYSYYSFDEHRKRADKYSALTAQKLHAAGKKASFIKPFLSAVGRFFAMYFIKGGILDGKMGLKIACISAASNRHKYSELRRLNREDGLE